MSWSIDDARVLPFLSGDDRRDLTAVLWRMSDGDRILHRGEEPGGGAVVPGRHAPKFKDWKDGKDSKEGKDAKETKDYKDWKDLKDSKDTKDWKDYKDGKDAKDHPEWASPPMAPSGRHPAVLAPELDVQALGESSGGDEDDVVAVLRRSRVNKYLWRAGLVI